MNKLSTIVLTKSKRDTTPKILESPLLNEFVNNFHKNTTQREVRQRMITFEEFVKKNYHCLIDRNFINKRLVTKQSNLKENKIYVYDMFREYVVYLKKKNLSRERIRYL